MKTRFLQTFLIPSALSLLVCGSIAAHADATDPLAASTRQGGVSITISVHGQQERDDLAITAPVQFGISVIKKYDTMQYIVLDSRLRVYTVLPLASAPLDRDGIPDITAFFQPATPSPSPETDTESMALTVVDEGQSQAPDLPGVQARHYSIDVVDTSDGAPSTGKGASFRPATRHIHSDLWVDPRYPRPVSPFAGDAARTVLLPGGDKLTYKFTGDTETYGKAISYLPVEMAGTGPGMSTALKQTAAIGTHDVDPALFQVPAGYKQLSQDDFSNAEYNAILDLISGPQPKLPGAQNVPGVGAAAPAGSR